MNTTKTKLLPLLLLLLLVPLVQAADVTVDWGTTTGTVSNKFYGVNVHKLGLSNTSFIDVNGDGTLDTASNMTWHRQAFLDSGVKSIRTDFFVGEVYGSMPNKFAEYWTAVQRNWTMNTSYYDNIPQSWTAESTSSSGNATILRQSVDCYSGNYCVNITAFNGTAGNYMSYWTGWTSSTAKAPQKGETYNFSVWVKTQSAFSIAIVNASNFVSFVDTSFTGNGSWQQYSVKANLTSNASSLRFYVRLNRVSGSFGMNSSHNTTMLWDNPEIYKDNSPSPFYYWRRQNASNTRNIDADISLIQWACQNNISVLSVMSGFPSEYANVTSDCSSSTGNCPPFDYSYLNQTIVDYYNLVTNNSQYIPCVEVGVFNEPDDGWMPGATSNTTRYSSAIEFYNRTRTFLKLAFPNMSVGSPALSRIDQNSGRFFLSSLLGNMTTAFDFVDWHIYRSTTNNADEWMPQWWGNVSTICSTTSANCSRVVLSEFNDFSYANQQNDSLGFAQQLALTFSESLNARPSAEIYVYQWTSQNNFSTGTGKYPGWPARYDMVQEPLLENRYASIFNVTKQMATYHAPGSQIVNCSSVNSGVACVAGVNGTRRFVTLINKNETNATVSLQSLNLPGNYFLYRSSGGIGYPTSGYAYTVTLTNSSVMTFELIFDASLLTSQDEYINSAANGLLKILGWLAAILVLGVFALFVGAATGKLDLDIGDNLLKIGLSVITVMLVLVVGIIIILSIGE